MDKNDRHNLPDLETRRDIFASSLYISRDVSGLQLALWEDQSTRGHLTWWASSLISAGSAHAGDEAGRVLRPPRTVWSWEDYSKSLSLGVFT